MNDHRIPPTPPATGPSRDDGRPKGSCSTAAERAGPRGGDGRGGYVIRVRGELGSVWARRFADWEFSVQVDHHSAVTTLSSASAVEQPQLHAALGQIRDLGLELLSVERRGGGG